ncbi:hypothetical protein QBC45DRAFT_419766 [Copromyces sp. CBS 386.78]|nr:hypothetical protein QBC45DRAFT_419766 [Copromyces sp. CBS 386.78]
MSPTLGILPEYHDRVLDKRARSSDADATRWWLLCRRLHLSKKFQTDDGKFDSDALAKALSEVMAGDRGDKDVPHLSRGEQHCLKKDREQERRLARERILNMTSQEMEARLKQQFGTFTALNEHKFSYDNLIYLEDFAGDILKVDNAACRAHEHYADQKDKEDHLKSLRRLVVDLGRAITECDSIQDYISVSNLLFWATSGILDLSIQIPDSKHVGMGALRSAVEAFLMNYVVSVLLVESKAKTLSPGLPELEQGIPSEDFDKLLRDQLEIVDTTISSARKIQLFQKPASYLTPEGRVDIESFAMEIAKGMVTDKQNSLPTPLKQVLDHEVDPDISEQIVGWNSGRRFQRQEGETKILLRREKEIMERLMGDGWIKSIMDRARIVSDDLLSPKAVKKTTKELAEEINKLIKNQLKEGIQIVKKKPENGEIHIRLTEVRPFIIDLGASVETWKRFPTYLSASLFLFWAAADAWWSLPTGDSSQEARNMQSIAEKFLRNYLALVLIDEVKPEAKKLEQSKAEQSKTGDSRAPSVTYIIPRKPPSSNSPYCCRF